MKHFKDKVAVITGAGSGIGRALAINLGQQGCHLALSDIDLPGLQETVALLNRSDLRVTVHQFDVSDREAVYHFAGEVIARHGKVDIVINNAGIASVGYVEEVDDATFERVINVNLWGVVHGTRAFLPHLKQRPEAALVNISSINGMVPFPGNGPYNISKYAVLGLNETLMMELRRTSVQVISVHPGGIQTNIANNALNAREEAKKAFNSQLLTTAPRAAEVIIEAIRRNRSHVFIGMDAKFMQFFKRFRPKSALAFSAHIMKKVLQQCAP